MELTEVRADAANEAAVPVRVVGVQQKRPSVLRVREQKIRVENALLNQVLFLQELDEIILDFSNCFSCGLQNRLPLGNDCLRKAVSVSHGWERFHDASVDPGIRVSVVTPLHITYQKRRALDNVAAA